ncbi:Hpt domain-containing protein [Vibrio sp. CAU 1672]|uniref:Hpt domain-containing protein n=1 Tax=Vibrio sp. CAU 1672 TaxID=3032594 RepID=UPI0023DCD012|nr:Hpt domain-containing protein [Vibrio sp. CAU 1672]MDF2153373.1 Hpt domain-containing protein [Vibrio sp. CAU 1672]
MIDFDELRKRMDHDLMFLTLRDYNNDYSDGPGQINKLYQSKSWSSLFLLAHSLKTILVSLGEQTATRSLARIETNTSNDVAPNLADIELINTELRTINTQIKKYLMRMD